MAQTRRQGLCNVGSGMVAWMRGKAVWKEDDGCSGTDKSMVRGWHG